MSPLIFVSRGTLKRKSAAYKATHEQLRAEMSAGIQTFDLTVAPSVNAMYATVHGRRIKSAAARKWAKVVLGELLAQRAKPSQTPVSISILLPNSLKGDGSNRIKATEDILVMAGVLPDDSRKYVQAVGFSFGETASPAVMRVMVRPL